MKVSTLVDIKLRNGTTVAKACCWIEWQTVMLKWSAVRSGEPPPRGILFGQTFMQDKLCNKLRIEYHCPYPGVAHSISSIKLNRWMSTAAVLGRKHESSPGPLHLPKYPPPNHPTQNRPAGSGSDLQISDGDSWLRGRSCKSLNARDAFQTPLCDVAWPTPASLPLLCSILAPAGLSKCQTFYTRI